VLRWSFLGVLLSSLVACGGPGKQVTEQQSTVGRSSSAHRNQAAPIERVAIDVGAQRAGHSLVVNVHGVGRGHASGEALENPKAWRVSAYGDTPLRQVLAGPAKVSRAPTGAALGDQWDIEIDFMVAFALPDRAINIEVLVQAPSGEEIRKRVSIEAPLERLTAL
jgi:hypothetical protein